MQNGTEKINNFRRPYGVLVAEQLAADLVRDERDARIEEEDRAVLADQRRQDLRVLAEGAAKLVTTECEECDGFGHAPIPLTARVPDEVEDCARCHGAGVIAAPDVEECATCGIELGDGHHKCRRATGTDLCLECAVLGDPPLMPDEECFL